MRVVNEFRERPGQTIVIDDRRPGARHSRDLPNGTDSGRLCTGSLRAMRTHQRPLRLEIEDPALRSQWLPHSHAEACAVAEHRARSSFSKCSVWLPEHLARQPPQGVSAAVTKRRALQRCLAAARFDRASTDSASNGRFDVAYLDGRLVDPALVRAPVAAGLTMPGASEEPRVQWLQDALRWRQDAAPVRTRRRRWTSFPGQG